MNDVIKIFTERHPVFSVNNDIERFLKLHPNHKVESINTKVHEEVVVVTVHLVRF